MKRAIFIFLCIMIAVTQLPAVLLSESVPVVNGVTFAKGVPVVNGVMFTKGVPVANGVTLSKGMHSLECTTLSESMISAEKTLLSAGSLIGARSSDDASDAMLDGITTPHLLLIEANTGTVLYERSADDKAYPASTTKLMTALLAIETLQDLDQVVTVTWRDVSGFGATSSLMGLVANEEIALRDVLYGLMMRSGNDAAKLLAIRSAQTVYGESLEAQDAIEAFVGMMNERAEELGMNSTHFATVDGRHNDDHYTTARDFGILMREALKNPLLCTIIGTETYYIEPNNMHPEGYYLENSNKLIHKKDTDEYSYEYEYCIGGKTGETNKAGYCLVSAAEKDGVKLILVQFGDDNNTKSASYRFDAAIKLYDWGFENYISMPAGEFALSIGLQTRFDVQSMGYSPSDGQQGVFNAYADLSRASITGVRAELNAIAAEPSRVRVEVRADNVEAPIMAGDIVGTVTYYFPKKDPTTVNLIADRDVAAAAKYTPEPHETAFISSTPPPGSGKNSSLALKRNPGGSEYSVWVYFGGSLYTMNSTEWHYIYCDENGAFRAAATPDAPGEIDVYRQVFDTSGVAYYVRADGIGSGGVYLIASGDRVMTSSSKGGTLGSVQISISADGIITSGITDDMLFTFENEGNGYHIMHDSRCLTRKAGSGTLFYILLAVLILVVIVTVKLIIENTGRRRRRRRRRRATHYRSSRR